LADADERPGSPDFLEDMKPASRNLGGERRRFFQLWAAYNQNSQNMIALYPKELED